MRTLSVLFAILLFLSLSIQAQTIVKQNKDGNYVAVKTTTNKASKAKPTGKYFIDNNGTKYPIMLSANSKLFYVKTSKKGNKYNVYIKPE